MPSLSQFWNLALGIPLLVSLGKIIIYTSTDYIIMYNLIYFPVVYIYIYIVLKNHTHPLARESFWMFFKICEESGDGM